MVIEHHVEGYEAFKEKMKEFTEKDLVHVYFSGSKQPNGDSWCDDCVRAWPSIKKQLPKAPETSHFVYVEVGDRPFWKDQKCPFRIDPDVHIMVLPTIIRWKQPQRLEGDKCENNDLVEMLFTDETDD